MDETGGVQAGQSLDDAAQRCAKSELVEPRRWSHVRRGRDSKRVRAAIGSLSVLRHVGVRRALSGGPSSGWFRTVAKLAVRSFDARLWHIRRRIDPLEEVDALDELHREEPTAIALDELPSRTRFGWRTSHITRNSRLSRNSAVA